MRLTPAVLQDNTYQAGKVNLAGGHAGLGTHGSLSPADMRACLAASGPAFRSDLDVTHATAHPDVVPTVLVALGLPRPSYVEGRPIVDALRPELADTVRSAASCHGCPHLVQIICAKLRAVPHISH